MVFFIVNSLVLYLFLFAGIFGAENAFTALFIFLLIIIIIGIYKGIKESPYKNEDYTFATTDSVSLSRVAEPARCKRVASLNTNTCYATVESIGSSRLTALDFDCDCDFDDDDFDDFEGDLEDLKSFDDELFDDDETEELNENADSVNFFGALSELLCLYGTDKGNRKNDFGDDSNYNWEIHCEYCEDLLEDCECDNRHESHEAISLWDCGCEDEDDESEIGSDLLDFDEFRS